MGQSGPSADSAPRRPTEANPGRRRFLKRIAVAISAFLGAAAGVPIVGAIAAPGFRRDEAPWLPVGQVSDFVVGQPRMVSLSVTKADGYVRSTITRPVWVFRPTDSETLIYNGRCTHLGCLSNYRPESRTFLCPCHGGVFALQDGRVLEGPPPRALDRLNYRLDGDQLIVQFRDFLVGVPESVAL